MQRGDIERYELIKSDKKIGIDETIKKTTINTDINLNRDT